MVKINRITKRQREVLDDLFSGIANEQEILEKHKVNKRLYNRWQADAGFAAEFERRLESARKQGELIIARFSTVAASKLVELTQSQNSETARKACLDIITLLRPGAANDQAGSPQDNSDAPADLPPELASRLLSALTGEK